MMLRHFKDNLTFDISDWSVDLRRCHSTVYSWGHPVVWGLNQSDVSSWSYFLWEVQHLPWDPRHLWGLTFSRLVLLLVSAPEELWVHVSWEGTSRCPQLQRLIWDVTSAFCFHLACLWNVCLADLNQGLEIWEIFKIHSNTNRMNFLFTDFEP